jgi:Bacterial PH domain
MKEVFPIVPAAGGPLFTFGITTLVLGSMIGFASRGPVMVFWIVAPVLSGLILLIGSFAYASRQVKFEVTPEGLAIRGDWYGRRLPSESLLIQEARAVDLTGSPEYRPVWRTNGAGLPGYGSGWFQLGNGNKALIFVTDKRRVVYLPTRDGYSLLLSVPEPEKFLAALRQMARQ